MKKLVVLAALLGLELFAPSARALDVPRANCNESHFKPCICASKAPVDIVYRPSLAACRGHAAAILSGDFSRSFSVVLRDRENRDRFPATGFNGCSASEAALGPNHCSAYKCQKTIRSKGSMTCCFGAAGNARVLSKATRLTIKVRDIPGNTSDPLLRVCLPLFNAKYPMN